MSETWKLFVTICREFSTGSNGLPGSLLNAYGVVLLCDDFRVYTFFLIMSIQHIICCNCYCFLEWWCGDLEFIRLHRHRVFL
jgi:hypothetical protein